MVEVSPGPLRERENRLGILSPSYSFLPKVVRSIHLSLIVINPVMGCETCEINRGMGQGEWSDGWKKMMRERNEGGCYISATPVKSAYLIHDATSPSSFKGPLRLDFHHV
jgi:hypothetical protein